ncbi:hypothetical protein KVR01_011888 [Diaporthe batatas]|uniref:uncharacterized protein n=1 Tax=Diaporthe batatas TaxID=748121 RepID=UPI001D05B8A8|nr:uncharacterized protein KVR01_011888 [Diaporthe batatas]KAG8158127.1 hypothetical protein KVR01_011888 [Diaporthe batatas]
MVSESSQAGSAVDGRNVYTLHNQPFSLFSMMVRFTYVLGRSSADNATDGVNIEYKLVDHHRYENLGEDYLINVNPKGQVPTLTGPKLPAPLTDSVDISYWLSGHYPKLLPPDLEPTIRDLFTKLHDIDIYCLCVRPESVPPEWRTSGVPPVSVDALLAKPDSEISPEYRKALLKKREFHVKTKNDALRLDQVERAEKQARDFFSELLSIRKTHGADSVWLFGPEAGPTILDAHTVPFIARMRDEKVGRGNLVPPELQEYASRVMGRPEWDEVMHGRPTIYDASMGPVRELDPLW